MASLLLPILLLLFLAVQTTTGTTPNLDIQPNTTVQTLQINGKDPSDLTWIQRWAAIGDSFTAGIGSGQVYSDAKEDIKCSRYDRSYVALLEREFGASVQDFQYAACSGHRTKGIYEQAVGLSGDLDLVVLTAGGNDLCLADIILTCIFLPFQGEKKCQEVLDTAQANIDSVLKPNIRQVLSALKPKMKKNGIVVYSLYAQFFDTTNNECVEKQDWSFPSLWLVDGLKLTIERREKFNELVKHINLAIMEVINEFRNDDSVHFRITDSDWDPWVRNGVKGQFCIAGSSGHYPDPKQQDLHFFRQDVSKRSHAGDEFKRDLEELELIARMMNETQYEEEANNADNMSLNSTLHVFDPRAPVLAKCPGDGRPSVDFGYGLPDRWGKFFHPNELGHITIASFALEAIIAERAVVLGVAHPICHKIDDFRCWKAADTHNRYVSNELLNKNYKTYCRELKPPQNFLNWHDERIFHDGTPEGHRFSVSLADGASSFSQTECEDAFDRIINGCWDKSIENPLNWKFGGRYVKGAYTYEINLVGTERQWPPMKKKDGLCEGWYKGILTRYTMYGAGWADWDNGQESLAPAIKSCVGGGLSFFKLQYFEKPNKYGMEWKATFNTPIFTRGRCFKNRKVARNAGGYTRGCPGNDA